MVHVVAGDGSACPLAAVTWRQPTGRLATCILPLRRCTPPVQLAAERGVKAAAAALAYGYATGQGLAEFVLEGEKPSGGAVPVRGAINPCGPVACSSGDPTRP